MLLQAHFELADCETVLNQNIANSALQKKLITHETLHILKKILQSGLLLRVESDRCQGCLKEIFMVLKQM